MTMISSENHRRPTLNHRRPVGHRRSRGILTLRAVIANGDFRGLLAASTSPASTSGRHPGINQGQYTLGA